MLNLNLIFFYASINVNNSWNIPNFTPPEPFFIKVIEDRVAYFTEDIIL